MTDPRLLRLAKEYVRYQRDRADAAITMTIVGLLLVTYGILRLTCG